MSDAPVQLVVAAERVALGDDEARDSQTGDEPPAEKAADEAGKE